jgi:hypothetical protein
LRGLGEGTSEGLPREKKGLREVAKRNFILNRWIQRACGRYPCSSEKIRGEDTQRAGKAEEILVVYWDRMRGKRTTLADTQVGKDRVGREMNHEVQTHEVDHSR